MKTELVNLIMSRDNIDYDIAYARINETIDEIINDPQDIVEIVEENLNLTYDEFKKYML